LAGGLKLYGILAFPPAFCYNPGMSETIHVLPVDDLFEHNQSAHCHCSPRVEYVEDGGVLVIHNSYDGREELEQMQSEVVQ